MVVNNIEINPENVEMGSFKLESLHLLSVDFVKLVY